MKTVTAAEANRQFSTGLREVAHGESVLVTSRGKPVANPRCTIRLCELPLVL